ncbi:XVIPCD domain-containing protein [Lysobacter silvisoli]|uniref:Uncharacterized protein n=1 Tax=Lysobacter silvisoli TaxID=2293254 RepID=A0A371K0G8_9GAMM|nr:XVIPCD domain-containing protein [Lysobacter silvisoli]RDZ27421.1 hypothetical protein DX914_14420 [Lysobacter silvisoli]
MGHQRIPVRLESGRDVTLVKWEDVPPPAHGDALQSKPWNASHKRSGVAFYESTIQYMRNDWAIAHMSPTPVSLTDRSGKGHNLLLFHNASTDTWHSADALDIDHARPWKEHLTALKVDNYADANRAYNDVGNLRLLPSTVNRARNSFENMLEEHGNDSPEVAAWVKKNFGYDAAASHPAFDEGSDLARRTKATTGASWEPEDGRKGLSFDTRVLDKWYNHQLEQTYAGTVELTSPTTGRKTEVPLFQCAATRQLVTRDAFDIDHEVPFEILATEMVKYAQGGTTKANALDAYNETSNLRLISRSANSSHEWELNQFGQYRDAGSELSDDSDLENDDDRAFIDDDEEPELAAKGMDLSDDKPGKSKPGPSAPLPSFGGPFGMAASSSSSPQPSMSAFATPSSMAASSSSPPLLDNPRHPDHRLYDQALKSLRALPAHGGLSEEQQRNAASSMAYAAKDARMGGIDRAFLTDGGTLFAVQDPELPSRRAVGLSAADAVKVTVEQNTAFIDRLPAVPKPGAQAQSQGHSFTF